MSKNHVGGSYSCKYVSTDYTSRTQKSELWTWWPSFISNFVVTIFSLKYRNPFFLYLEVKKNSNSVIRYIKFSSRFIIGLDFFCNEEVVFGWWIKSYSHLMSGFALNFKNGFFFNKWWCSYLTFAFEGKDQRRMQMQMLTELFTKLPGP